MSALESRAVYVIGPTNAGKSSACRLLAEAHGVEWINLDQAVKLAAPPSTTRIAAAQDWNVLEPLLVDADSRPVLVDIGAGTQDTRRGRLDPRFDEWLAGRRLRVVLFTAELDLVVERD